MNENQVLFKKKRNHLFGSSKIISDAIDEMDSTAIPAALQKMTIKIERSSICLLVSHGSGQAARSLVVR